MSEEELNTAQNSTPSAEPILNEQAAPANAAETLETAPISTPETPISPTTASNETAKIEPAPLREPLAHTANEHKQNTKKANKNTFGLKPLIAVALICSLLGGLIGGGIVALLRPTSTSSGGGSTTTTINVADGTSPISAIAKANMPAVVSIVNNSSTTYNDVFFGRNYTQETKASGSGVIISTDGYIVTNYHVIENAYKLTVTLYDGRNFEAQLIGGDESTDLAVLKIEADNLTAATIGDSDALEVGDLLVAIGNPLDAQALAWTVTDGIVSGLGRTVESDGQSFTLIQTNAAINAGNSGGALLNGKGELVGINSMKISGSSVEGMGFAIPINDAKPIIDQLISQGYVSRPYLGIAGYNINENLLSQVSLKRDNGILVTQLTKNGPAEKYGVKVGDIIYEADGKTIASFDDLSAVLDEHNVGDTITLKINRDGSDTSVDVTLGEQGTKLELQSTPTKTSYRY